MNTRYRRVLEAAVQASTEATTPAAIGKISDNSEAPARATRGLSRRGTIEEPKKTAEIFLAYVEASALPALRPAMWW